MHSIIYGPAGRYPELKELVLDVTKNQKKLSKIMEETNFNHKENNMLKPLTDWIITKRVEMAKKEKKSLIIVPETVKKEKEKQKYVKIVAMGPDADPDEYLTVGQTIMVPEMTGLKIKHEGVEYEMAKLPNMICIVGE